MRPAWPKQDWPHSRHPRTTTDLPAASNAAALPLDVTEPTSVAAAAAGDVTLLVNNAYAVAKSAERSLKNGVRLELASQGTLVSRVVFGPTATETMRTHASDAVRNDPVDVVRTALDGIEAGTTEIIADRFGAEAKAALSGPPRGFVLETVPHG